MYDEYNRERLTRYPMWLEQPLVFEMVLEVLTRHDPTGICTPSNPNAATEYSLEVNTILSRLPEAHSVEELRLILVEEFRNCFGSGMGPSNAYAPSARDIWAELDSRGLRVRLAEIKDDCPLVVRRFVQGLMQRNPADSRQDILKLAGLLHKTADELEQSAAVFGGTA